MNASRGHLRLVKLDAPPATVRPCNCRSWGSLSRLERDLLLGDLMQWAWIFCNVGIKLLARSEHVAICELIALKPGLGHTREVMRELCTWADCARVTFELTPSDHWGSNVEGLTRFYISLGFTTNTEPRQPFCVQEDMIRYPVRGGGHGSR